MKINLIIKNFFIKKILMKKNKKNNHLIICNSR